MDKETIFFTFGIIISASGFILGVLQFSISGMVSDIKKRCDRLEEFRDHCEDRRKTLKKEIKEEFKKRNYNE